MQFDTLQDWLKWLESCHPSEIDLGLQRITQVAERMALSLAASKVITVAGTNGKGSCVATLNTLLLHAGYKVGCFTSPHFLRYNERVLVNGQEATDQQLIQSFQKIQAAQKGISLTYFEFGTLAAIDIFQQSALDFVILEVGLGGRLDAVNIIDADIAVVTSIALDHQDWLGSDLEQIGREKAGIFRANAIAISAGLSPPDSIAKIALDVGSRFYQAGEDFHFVEQSGAMTWRGQSGDGRVMELSNLPVPNLPRESVAAAIQAIALAGIAVDGMDLQAIASVTLPGRFQQLSIQGKSVILDVAHNPAAAAYLAEKLQQQTCSGVTYALIGIMADKDVTGVISSLQGAINSWYTVDLRQTPRAMAGDKVASIIKNLGSDDVTVSQSVSDVCRQLLTKMTTDDRLIICGSFFTVADAMQFFAV